MLSSCLPGEILLFYLSFWLYMKQLGFLHMDVLVISPHMYVCYHIWQIIVSVAKPNNQKQLFNFLLPGWSHRFRPSWPPQLATSLLLPVRTSSKTSKSSNASTGLGSAYITCAARRLLTLFRLLENQTRKLK